MKLLRLVCALFTLTLVSGAVYGQAVNGSLLGSVADSTGAVVANAKVTITEVNTGVSREAETNASGNYTFPNLPPGTYDVAVEQTGFRREVRSRVEVLVNATARVDVTLQPGNVSESINVTAETPPLQTDRSDTGRKIETKTIENLPLATNRNFQGLLNLVPGTTRAFRPHSPFFNSQDSLSTQVNGQPRQANDTQIEGVDDQQRTGLNTVYIPPVEALQTVDVTTSNYDAELGRAGGAVTNVILKSGTNQIHGSAYEFNNVSALAARTFFAATKPVSTYNYFGGTIGGPVIKNKTFFFFDFLRTTDHRGLLNRFQLPTNDFRNGDFSAALTNPRAISSSYTGPVVVYDPLTGRPDGSGRTAFPGNRIPDSRISPIARRILALIPAPNLAGYGTNFVQNGLFVRESNSMDIKIDHNAGERDRFAIRYSEQRPTLTVPPIFGVTAGGPQDPGGGAGFQGTGKTVIQMGALNYTHIFSPTLITEGRFGLMHYRNEARNADYGTTTATDLGIKGVNLDQWTSGIPTLEINNAGYSNPLVGYSASLPWIRGETHFIWVNTWTKTLGNHTIKWGGDVRRVREELLQTQTFNPRGVFRYSDTITSCNTRGSAPCPNGAPSGIVESFASFLLDMPNQIGRDIAVQFPTYRQSQFFFFAQDTWQVTKKLTLNYGLRWEFYKPATSRFAGGFSNYNFTNNTLELGGIGNVPSDLGLKANYKNFGPRLGVAYRITEKTVIRAGYGISYGPFPDNRYAYDNFPVKQNFNYNNNVNTYFPATLPGGSFAGLASGFPAPQLASIPANGIISPAPLQDYNVVNLNFKEGYTQAWNFAIQQSLPKNLVAEVAYVGNHGTRFPVQYNLNAGMIQGAGAAGQPLFGPFRRTQDTILFFNGFDSHYHSLQAKLDKRFSGGFSITTAYTLGKALAPINGEDAVSGLQYYVNPRRNYSRTSFDRRHTFVQSYIYELPFGKGKPFLQQGIGSWLLGGWQLTGVLSVMSGLPMNFTTSAGALNTPGTVNNSPNINGPVKVLHGINTAPWFDTSNFSAPLPGQFGNLGRFTTDGPGFFNLDASISRRFPITERFNLELRGEGYSITNTPQFSNPNSTFGNASFGRVTSTLAVGNAGSSGGNRSFQLGARLSF
jgi:Carboxypeptidase regulatory-like domain